MGQGKAPSGPGRAGEVSGREALRRLQREMGARGGPGGEWTGLLQAVGDEMEALDRALQAGDASALLAACAGAADRLRPVLRGLVHYYLGTPVLRTRDVMRDARQLIAAGAPR